MSKSIHGANRPDDSSKHATITLRVPQSQRDAIDQLAADWGLPASIVYRWALASYLKNPMPFV